MLNKHKYIDDFKAFIIALVVCDILLAGAVWGVSRLTIKLLGA